jgi:hypothetical protein
MTEPEKPKKNYIIPTTPLFASIMEPLAKKMVKKLCKVKHIKGHEGHYINTVREVTWNQGPGNDNLEACKLAVGTKGLVVGIAEPKTMLRFMVVSPDDPKGKVNEDAIYHVNVLNLEVMKNPEEEEEEENE